MANSVPGSRVSYVWRPQSKQKPKNIFVLPFFRISAYYFHCFSQSFAFRRPLLLSLSSLFVCVFIYVYEIAESHTLAHWNTRTPAHPHTTTPTKPYECANLYTRVLVFLTCMSRFVCLEFYYTEKKCFLLFHFGFCFVGRITKVKAPRLVI